MLLTLAAADGGLAQQAVGAVHAAATVMRVPLGIYAVSAVAGTSVSRLRDAGGSADAQECLRYLITLGEAQVSLELRLDAAQMWGAPVTRSVVSPGHSPGCALLRDETLAPPRPTWVGAAGAMSSAGAAPQVRIVVSELSY